jgi:hypothetical protein
LEIGFGYDLNFKMKNVSIDGSSLRPKARGVNTAFALYDSDMGYIYSGRYSNSRRR